MATIRQALVDHVRSIWAQGVPLGGILGKGSRPPLAFTDPDPILALASIIPPSQMDSDIAQDVCLDAMRTLQDQVRLLRSLAAEEDQGNLLKSFASLPHDLPPPPSPTSSSPLLQSTARASSALLASMNLVYKETHPDRQNIEVPEEELAEKISADLTQFHQTLDRLASPLAAPSPPSPALLRAALFDSEPGPKLRLDANEWLYDRFTKFLPPYVLREHKGIPLALAALYQATALRAGLPCSLLSGDLLSRHYARLALFPRPLELKLRKRGAEPSGPALVLSLTAEDTGTLAQALLSASQGPAYRPDIPLWALAKQSASVANTALRSDPWLALTPLELSTSPPSSTPLLNNAWLTLDPAKRGALVETCRESLTYLFGSAASSLMLQSLEQRGLGEFRDLYLLGYGSEGFQDVTGLWINVVRTVVQGYQRRGESEDVARWLPLQLALDPSCDEWSFMLKK